MGIEIFDFQQGTPEWFACRLGIPTASEFHSMLAKGEGKTRKTYMLKLLGERLTGESQDSFTTVHTERGKIMEAEARELYSFDVPQMRQIGFIRRKTDTGLVGCSPDALIGDEGLLEVKTKLPHLQLAVIIADKVPSEHVAQCQGALWVTGRKWLDFLSYWPGLPLFVKRVYPDLEYFATLETALAEFHKEMDAIQAALPAIPTTRTIKKTAQILNEFTDLDFTH
jgi:hypothetical protein